MPQARPKAAPTAPKAAPKKAVKSGDKVTVKNITKRKINLTHGGIEPDKQGTATMAELSNYADRLERV